jgi:hypothetical protein
MTAGRKIKPSSFLLVLDSKIGVSYNRITLLRNADISHYS